MTLNSAAAELEKSLMASPEFMNLMRVKEEASKNPKIASLLTAFNKKQEILYASSNLPPEQIRVIVDEIHSDYEKLESVPEIKRYFNAAEAFNKLLGGVIDRLQASIGRAIS